jgi:CubicO group peptidase (beta-lactamase class C family)
VERVSGQTLPVFAEANIFKPLGMIQTHFHDDAARIVPNRATGYSRAANGFRVAVRTYTDVVVVNAGVFTTVRDLLRWEQNVADVRVGDPALITEMQTPTIAMSDTSGYGFGLVIARHRGLRTIGHGGGDEGRRTHVVRYRDHGVAIAVLCNLDDIDPELLARSIADILLSDRCPEAAVNATGATAAPVSVSLQDLQSRSVSTAIRLTNLSGEYSFEIAS